MKRTFFFSILLSIFFGIGISWIDSRPNWDDTGITVLMVLIAAFACGFIANQKPWLFALLVSIWIPVAGVLMTQNFGSLLAIVPGFIGAYAGYGFKRMIAKS